MALDRLEILLQGKVENSFPQFLLAKHLPMNYDSHMVTAEQRKKLADALDSVSAPMKDKTVYRVKFGVDDGIYKTNEETGKLFRMTREAVRQSVTKVQELIDRK